MKLGRPLTLFLAALGLTATALAADAGNPPATAGQASARSALAWADLLTSGSPADLAPFYMQVLGWTAETMGEGRDAYVRLSSQGRPVAGIAHRPSGSPGLPKTRWLGFLSVPNLPDATQRATGRGARILMPARAWPGHGNQAVLADPEGATFGLVEVEKDTGPETGAAPGEWLWPALLADDAFKAADFYGSLLGFQVTDDTRTPFFGGDMLLTEGGRARAGVVALPLRAGKRPGWLWFVRVADLDATVHEVEKQGGHALRRPGIDLMGGRLAVVADPCGAVFGLIEIIPAPPPGRTPKSVLRP